jgi:hypothetical protein
LKTALPKPLLRQISDLPSAPQLGTNLVESQATVGTSWHIASVSQPSPTALQSSVMLTHALSVEAVHIVKTLPAHPAVQSISLRLISKPTHAASAAQPHLALTRQSACSPLLCQKNPESTVTFHISDSVRLMPSSLRHEPTTAAARASKSGSRLPGSLGEGAAEAAQTGRVGATSWLVEETTSAATAAASATAPEASGTRGARFASEQATKPRAKRQADVVLMRSSPRQ